MLDESGHDWSNSDESEYRLSKKDSRSNIVIHSTQNNRTGGLEEHKFNHMMRSV